MTKEVLLNRISECIDNGCNTKEINILIGIYKRANEVPSEIHDIVFSVVLDYYLLDIETIKSSTRLRYVVDARKIICLILRDNGYTYQSIGGLINRHHAAVIHTYKSCKNLIDTDRMFRKTFDIISKKIKEEQIKFNLK